MTSHGLLARRVPPSRRCSGATTAEYAVGTVGAATIAAVLVRVAGDGTFLELVRPSRGILR